MPDQVTPEISAYFQRLGKKGGAKRAKSLGKKRLSAIARKAGIASGKARKRD